MEMQEETFISKVFHYKTNKPKSNGLFCKNNWIYKKIGLRSNHDETLIIVLPIYNV